MTSTSVNDTLFIRNLSFETEQDTLKEFFENNYGPTSYCLICRDKNSGESKGTAFVKFKDQNHAEKCLSEFKDYEFQSKFHIDGRNVMILPALTRDEASIVKQDSKDGNKKKDKRNLALAKEGFIHPKSEEFKQMSKVDAERRKLLAKRKEELLKNLHNFVSDTRLCVHNLPSSVDDQKLRKIFLDHIKSEHPTAKITECRVMRNKKGSGELGTSKGFGFVAFSKPEHSLAALRCINNNDSIFSNDKRPIVEFSIENLVALNKKKTRLANSQRKKTEKSVQKDQNASSNKKSSNADKKSKAKAKKIISKKMKRRGTAPVKIAHDNEQENLLKKIAKVQKNRL